MPLPSQAAAAGVSSLALLKQRFLVQQNLLSISIPDALSSCCARQGWLNLCSSQVTYAEGGPESKKGAQNV